MNEFGSEVGHAWAKLDTSEGDSQSPASSLLKLMKNGQLNLPEAGSCFSSWDLQT